MSIYTAWASFFCWMGLAYDNDLDQVEGAGIYKITMILIGLRRVAFANFLLINLLIYVCERMCACALAPLLFQISRELNFLFPCLFLLYALETSNTEERMML